MLTALRVGKSPNVREVSEMSLLPTVELIELAVSEQWEER